MGRIVKLLFYGPLVINLLNLQAFVSKFISASIAQLMAYLNVGLIFLGLLLILKQRRKLPKLILLWLLFFSCYFVFGLIANGFHGTQPTILRVLIPGIYLIGYSFFLSTGSAKTELPKVLAYSFFVSCLLLFLLQYFNFSLDHDGVYEYSLDRASGVYGDANNAAVASILSFIFVKHILIPKTKWQKMLKSFALLFSAYALLLTFSKTGIVVFLLVLMITYRKMFNIKRILVSAILIPFVGVLLINWASTTTRLSEGQKHRIENVVNIISLQTDKVSFSERDVLFKNMLGYIYENPFIGNGLNFAVEIRGHNTVFGVWADAGFLTFTIFLFLLFHYYKDALTAKGNIANFSLAILVTLSIFMLSLQTIINQGYLIVVFIYIGYVLDKNSVRYPSSVISEKQLHA